MAFQKAVKHDAKLRLSIQGPSGSGKTYSALAIATAMNVGKVAFLDTEHGSASKYADLFDFDVMELHAPYHPDRFVEAIRDAAQAGYGVIILDSLTHAWKGEGGILELVTEIAKRKYGGNSYAGWNDATPIQKRLIEGIVGAPIHVIATMRSKMDYVQEKDEKGNTRVRKVGMAAEQRDDFPYEFDVVLDMNIDNEGVVSKTRCPELTGRVIAKPGKQIAATLVKWLHGAPTEEKVKASFASADEALRWGLSQGCFRHYEHAKNAYEKLKAEHKPRTAADMFALWIGDVERRVKEIELGGSIEGEAQSQPVDNPFETEPVAA